MLEHIPAARGYVAHLLDRITMSEASQLHAFLDAMKAHTHVSHDALRSGQHLVAVHRCAAAAPAPRHKWHWGQNEQPL